MLNIENGTSKILGMYFCEVVVAVKSRASRTPLFTTNEKVTNERATTRAIRRHVFALTEYILTVILYR